MNRLVTRAESDESDQPKRGNLVLILLLGEEDELKATGKGETVMTVTEAAHELGVLRQSVLKMVRNGKITPAAWWEGRLLFKESEIQDMKERRSSP
jgi:excisionase family DNA binding protein